MLLEVKSHFDGDRRLPARVAEVLAGYRGPAAPMSFDPDQVALLRQSAPHLLRGLVAAKYRPHPYWDQMPAWLRYGMGSLLPAPCTPGRISSPMRSTTCRHLRRGCARHVFGLPLLTWTVRTERARSAPPRMPIR